MDKDKENLKGSPSRDLFKQLHKRMMPRSFYACDLDFVLISKYPNRIVAFIDYKTTKDYPRFSEVVAYNELIKQAPLFIIQSKKDDIETGPFHVFQYLGGDPAPEPPEVDINLVLSCLSWKELAIWEKEIRNNGVPATSRN